MQCGTLARWGLTGWMSFGAVIGCPKMYRLSYIACFHNSDAVCMSVCACFRLFVDVYCTLLPVCVCVCVCVCAVFIFLGVKKKRHPWKFLRFSAFWAWKKKVHVKKFKIASKSARENLFLHVKKNRKRHTWKLNECTWKKSKKIPVKTQKWAWKKVEQKIWNFALSTFL